MQRLASIYFDIPALWPGTTGAYILAFLCAGIATTLRIAIDPYVLGPQYITFVPAVIITTLIGGWVHAFFASCLPMLAVDLIDFIFWNCLA